MTGTWDAAIDLDWGGERRRFRLGIGELVALQDRVAAGPVEILNRLRDQTWRVADLKETIRLGLEGGGLAPGEAAALVRRYVEGRPLMESVPVAMVVLASALFTPDDLPGKAAGGEEGATTAASPSPGSTETPS